jgi:hypothetical protein
VDTKQQHDMIQLGGKNKKQKASRPSALSEHAPRPRSVTDQSFRKKVAEDLAQTRYRLRIVGVPEIEWNGVF